jgi:nucleoside-diphosphate-sugar epimerase
MTKNSFTIFGQGFVGTNISIFLKKKKCKLFIPKKGKYKFKKNLHNVVYCIGNQNWLKDPEVTYNANLAMVPKIIFNNKFDSFTLLSTTRLYFANPNTKTSENDPININSNNKNFLYNSFKIAAENLCLTLNNKNIKVIRMSNLFGDNFTNQAYILPTWIRDSIINKKIDLFINKNSTKDFIYVDDAFDVLLKIIKTGKHRLYNVASGKNIKLSKILKEIKKITNCKINYANSSNIIKEPKINIKRIVNEFNFKPKNNLIDLLNDLIINYKNNLLK